MQFYYDAAGYKVNLPLFPGLNQQDTNILYASNQICILLGSETESPNWSVANMLLEARPNRQQIDAMIASAQENLCGA